MRGPSIRKSFGLSATVLLASISASTALTAISDWTTGFATFYGGQPDGMSPYSPSYGTSVGSCGFGMLDKMQWPYWTVGALSTSNQFFQSGPTQACGMCFQVTCVEDGPLGSKPGSCQKNPADRSIVVQITDQCPECGADHMDLQALTWARIANPSPAGGRVNVQSRRVECAPPSSITVSVNNNLGNNAWMRLQIMKTGGRAGVSKVELRGNSGVWQSMNNVWGASWETPQAPPPPLDIRITDDQGNTVTAPHVIRADETGLLPTSVQFNIQDPSDVQPSGIPINTAANIISTAQPQQSGKGSTPNESVQAFSGPPDDSSSSGPTPSSSSTSSSPSPQSSSPYSASASHSASSSPSPYSPSPYKGGK